MNIQFEVATDIAMDQDGAEDLLVHQHSSEFGGSWGLGFCWWWFELWVNGNYGLRVSDSLDA